MEKEVFSFKLNGIEDAVTIINQIVELAKQLEQVKMNLVLEETPSLSVEPALKS